jgi:cytochrome c2
MFRRFLLPLILAAGVALALIVPALAGGWAVITLDALPKNVTAGKAIEVGITVRQHGVTLVQGLEVTVRGYQPASQSVIQATAQELKQPGRYTASLVFPEAGTWEWSVLATPMEQRMPDLVVLSGAPSVTQASEGEQIPAERPFLLAGALCLALGVGAAYWALRRRLRLAWVAAGVLGILAAASLLFTSQPPAQAAEVEMPVAPDLTPAELGEKLFVAKGCVTCHIHPAFAGKDYVSVGIKDLTGYTAIPEYLRVWLKNPASVKPETEMPNLELKEGEIEALIAFLANNDTASK